MKRLTIDVYTPSELKQLDSNAFDYAFDRWKQDQYGFGYDWGDEIIDSLKAVFEHSNIALRDWEIDSYSHGHSSVKFDMEISIESLSGQRAIAWLENNLLNQFRYKDGIQHIKERVWMSEHIKSHTRSDGVFIHKPGELKSCPLTGCCFDEDFLESLIKDINSGYTLFDAYRRLAKVASRLFENEWEQQTSEESFLEQDHLEYKADGRLL